MDISILSNMIIRRFYSASTMYTEANTKAKRINRPCWGIIIKYEGETTYTVKDKEIVSNINNIVILPKGCSYEWLCTKSGHFEAIEFECETECDEIFTFQLKDGEKLLKMVKELEYKHNIKGPLYKMESIRDCYSIILRLISSKQQKYIPGAKQQKIAPALDFIAKNYDKEIKNAELAQLTGLSTVYFRKLFTEVTGTSPIAYVHRLRIKKAKEMLKSDYGSITEIAKSLGYLNIYDFSRTFKKHTGISPSKY